MEIKEPDVSYGKQKMTIEEYLEFEKNSLVKHEYYQGEVYAMAGTKIPHNMISSNVFGGLCAFLKGKPCKPFGSDLRTHVEKSGFFTYPTFQLCVMK